MTEERKQEVFEIVKERFIDLIDRECLNYQYYDDIIEGDELLTYEEFEEITELINYKIEVILE